MSNKTSLEVVDRLFSSGPSSLLDRPDASQVHSSLSEVQALVDQTVSHSIDEIAKPETMIALLGASGASRLTRMGVMSSVSMGEGKIISSLLAKGGSYALALANESATFTGIERGFAHLEGHSSSESFEKAWARSAISLGSLKFFGKVTEGQNIVLQHLSADFGMVSAENLGATFLITDRPHGTLAEQMLQAEAMNWNMKGSQALLHGLSPGLFATERSLDLYLKNHETDLFSPKQSFPFFSQLMPATEGVPEGFFAKSQGLKGPERVMMAARKGKDGGSHIKEMLKDLGLNSKQQSQLSQVVENVRGNVGWAHALSVAIKEMKGIELSPEKKCQLLLQVAEKAGKEVCKAYYDLSKAIAEMKDFGSPELQYRFFLQVAEKGNINAYGFLPRVIRAMSKAGWGSPVQRFQLLLQVAEKAKEETGLAFDVFGELLDIYPENSIQIRDLFLRVLDSPNDYDRRDVLESFQYDDLPPEIARRSFQNGLEGNWEIIDLFPPVLLASISRRGQIRKGGFRIRLNPENGNIEVYESEWEVLFFRVDASKNYVLKIDPREEFDTTLYEDSGRLPYVLATLRDRGILSSRALGLLGISKPEIAFGKILQQKREKVKDRIKLLNKGKPSKLPSVDQYSGSHTRFVYTGGARFIDPMGDIDGLYTDNANSCVILIALSREPQSKRLLNIGMAHISVADESDFRQFFRQLKKGILSEAEVYLVGDPYVMNQDMTFRIFRVLEEEKAVVRFMSVSQPRYSDAALVDRHGKVYYGWRKNFFNLELDDDDERTLFWDGGDRGLVFQDMALSRPKKSK